MVLHLKMHTHTRVQAVLTTNKIVAITIKIGVPLQWWHLLIVFITMETALTISSYQSVPPPSSQSQVGIRQQNTIVGERGHTVSVYINNTLSDLTPPTRKHFVYLACSALILWQYILKGTNAMYPSRVYMDHKIPCTLGCALRGYIQLPSGTNPIHPIDIHGTTITCTSNVSTHQ